MKKGDLIFLSASVPYRKEWTEGVRPSQIEEFVVNVARAVFSRGGRLLFGGHPSISPLVASIASEYYKIDPQRKVRPVVTFQSELFRGQLPDETWDMYRLGFSSIIWRPDKGSKESSLTTMRSAMLGGWSAEEQSEHDLSPPRAMLTIGGMEGILEETAIFLRQRRKWPNGDRTPIYLSESSAGASQRLLEPMKNWDQRLWIGTPPGENDRRELYLAGQSQSLLSVEREWARVYQVPDFKAREYLPYASIAQWFVDSLDAPEALLGEDAR
ncbi:MAG TPA: hypothetical protein VMF06_24215 [Candidatus Limnocylindria bacterium]|jgi:hypothetical protein|nr:hypothetical protein [Candidatus Limnocylindria bacterium]